MSAIAMKICVPINEDLGLKSEICLSFASTPKLIIIDPATMSYVVLDNDRVAPGADDDELAALLRHHDVGSVVVAGIGLEPLMALKEVGIEVFSSEKERVEEIVEAIDAGLVKPVELSLSCDRHGTGRGFQGPGSCGGCRGMG